MAAELDREKRIRNLPHTPWGKATKKCKRPKIRYAVSFHLTAVTMYHTMSVLKQQNFFFFHILEGRSMKLRCQRGCTPSKGCKRKSIACLFYLLVVPGVPLACGHITEILTFLVTLLPPLLSQNFSCLSSYLWLHLGSIWVLQDKLLLSRCNLIISYVI